jgi:hypothetical protein
MLLAALCLLFSSLRAVAQFEVGLELDKLNYVAGEPMTATVTIVNRSGADVVMGHTGSKAWLTFNVTDSLDRSISPYQLTPDKPLVFPAGEKLRKQVRVTDSHALVEPGTFAMTVSVLHPNTSNYYQSNRKRFVIVDEKPFAQPIVFGVPAGMPEAGRVRRYALLEHRTMDNTQLYFRLIDDSTGQQVHTYRLGPFTRTREPQFTLDKHNNFHVLFMVAKNQTAYYVIGPDGKPKSLEQFRDGDGTRPQLYLTKENTVVATGGVAFNPADEQSASAAAAAKTRSVSERPTGL